MFESHLGRNARPADKVVVMGVVYMSSSLMHAPAEIESSAHSLGGRTLGVVAWTSLSQC